MKTHVSHKGRRAILKGGLAAAVAWMARSAFRPLYAQQKAALITAAPVARVPTDPDDPAWSRAIAALVALQPQNLVVPGIPEAGAKQVNVRALYDADRLALLLEWNDAHKDADLGTVLQYRDAVAVQLPENPALGPTSYMMGQRGRGVIIYHWKSDWQFGQLHDVDEAHPNMYNDWYPYSGVEAGKVPEASDYLTRGRKEYLTAAAVGNALADPLAQKQLGPVQKMRAEGFGTIEPHPTQDGAGYGLWRDGSWRIVISIPRRQENYTLGEGATVPVAFAVWDGSRNERNGQKAMCQWKDLGLGLPIPEASPVTPPAPVQAGGSILGPVFGGIAGAVAAALALLIGVRMRRPRSGDTERQA